MSNKHSGATSYKETRFGILPRSKVIPLEIAGTKKGLLFLKDSAQKQEILTSELIKQLHKYCFSDILRSKAGKFRTIQVTYSRKEAPHFSKIPELMKVLCEDIEYAFKHLPDTANEYYIERVVELLARFQHRFVYIHPFVDYNGRIARIFTSFILMRLQLPIIEVPIQKRKDRTKYVQSLQEADKGDHRLLEVIISRALNESLEKLGT